MVNNAAASGYFGIGIFYPKAEVNVGVLMRSAFCMGASFVFNIGHRYKRFRTDTVKSTNHIPLYNYAEEDYLNSHLKENG